MAEASTVSALIAFPCFVVCVGCVLLGRTVTARKRPARASCSAWSATGGGAAPARRYPSAHQFGLYGILHHNTCEKRRRSPIGGAGIARSRIPADGNDQRGSPSVTTSPALKIPAGAGQSSQIDKVSRSRIRAASNAAVRRRMRWCLTVSPPRRRVRSGLRNEAAARTVPAEHRFGEEAAGDTGGRLGAGLRKGRDGVAGPAVTRQGLGGRG